MKQKLEELTGLRIGAFLIDFIIALIACSIFYEVLSSILIYFGYLLLKDGIFYGQSIGKRIIGLKVVDYTTKQPCTLWQSVKRNFLLVIMIPIMGFLELILMSQEKREFRRIGDIIANTAVVRVKNFDS